MKFQRNKVRGVSSALYWLLILGVVASYFAITVERDPAPGAYVASDEAAVNALADAETGREDYGRPRVDALRAFPPHTDSYSSDDSAPLEGRRTVRSGSGQTATRRDSAPQPADVVLDVGSKKVTGRVTDDLGRPLAGADFPLCWVLRENSLVPESLRNTTSGAGGRSGFTQVGVRSHRTIACAPGFEVAQIEEEVGGVRGGNLDLQLVPLIE